MDGMLSQEEINALLGGMDLSNPEPAVEEEIDSQLNDMEKDTMGEISNISMGTAATTLSSLVNQKVDITTPHVSFSNWEALSSNYDRPCVFLRISYKEGIYGDNILILRDRDVKIITDLMMGGDGTNPDSGEIGELHLSAISEAMNQMMGTAATSLSSMLNSKIDITPPVASLVDLNDTNSQIDAEEFGDNSFVKIAFKMKIGELVDSEIMQLFPVDFCKSLCNKFMDTAGLSFDSDASSTESSTPAQSTSAPAPQPEVAPSAPSAPIPEPMAQNVAQMGMMPTMMPGMMPGMMPTMMPGMMPGMVGSMPANYAGSVYGQPEINVQAAQFQTFSPEIVAANQRENINLIMDVPLEVTVELGRTRKSIQDILECAPGTIIELDKIAGEPVDVLVNGKFVAKGEVVVIEESFGVRVTEIIK